MRRNEFKKWMMNQKRFYNGKWDFYTELATNSRISCLEKLELIFNIDIDEKVQSRSIADEFLNEIRNAHIEDLRHTPLSNAFRHYFKFATGNEIPRIF